MKPQNNQVIISWSCQSEESLKSEFSKKGLILPKNVEGREQMIEMGEVLAFADPVKDIHGEPIKLKKGDKILFATFTTFDLIFEEKAAYSINGRDIIAIL